MQDDNKLMELTTCNKSVELNKPMTTCQQAGNKQCKHILLTSCWNSIATNLLQVCYVVFNKREVVFYQSTKGRGRSPRPFVL